MSNPVFMALYLFIKKLKTSVIMMGLILIFLIMLTGALGNHLKNQIQQFHAYYQYKLDISALYSQYQSLTKSPTQGLPVALINATQDVKPLPVLGGNTTITTCPTQKEVINLIQNNISHGLEFIQKTYRCYPKKVEIKNSTFLNIELSP